MNLSLKKILPINWNLSGDIPRSRLPKTESTLIRKIMLPAPEIPEASNGLERVECGVPRRIYLYTKEEGRNVFEVYEARTILFRLARKRVAA